MGTARSLAAVSRQLGKHVTLIERWSKRWGWVARAWEYDARLTKEWFCRLAAQDRKRFADEQSATAAEQLANSQRRAVDFAIRKAAAAAKRREKQRTGQSRKGKPTPSKN